MNAALDWLKVRVCGMIARCVLHRTDERPGFQSVQVQAGPLRILTAERLNSYGFRSHAPVGSEGVVVFPGGSPDHPVVIALDQRDKPKIPSLDEGDVAIYASDGQSVIIRQSRGVLIRSGDGDSDAEIEITKDTITLKAKLIQMVQA